MSKTITEYIEKNYIIHKIFNYHAMETNFEYIDNNFCFD